MEAKLAKAKDASSKKITSQIEEMRQLRKLGVERIRKIILDMILPDQERIGSGVIVHIRDLSDDLCLTPFYYDFELQRQELVRILDQSPELFASCVKTIIDGKILYKGNHGYRFHPIVIEELKKIY